MERVSGDLLRAPGFPKGPAGPLAVPRASELAAGFSAAFWPVKKRHRRKPEADPCGPQCIQNKESNPVNVPAGGEAAGKAKPHGGVKTPPYRVRERGRSTARSRQDKIARAACRPPLRPNGRRICGPCKTPPL